MKKHLSIIIFSVILSGAFFFEIVYAQNGNMHNFDVLYQEDYERLFGEGKYSELFDHLQIWEAKEPDNPELYIAYFNFYINRSRFSGVSIVEEKSGSGAVLELLDPETGDIAGYIQDTVQYSNEDIARAIEYLDRGLNCAPDRLDMYFGKIHILNEVELYERAGSTLLFAIEFSKQINNRWLWAGGEYIENGEAVFLESIQDYYGLWLEEETEETFEQVKRCTEKQIELYPDNIFAYNVLAVYYLLKGQYMESLHIFLGAERIDKNDCIVLANIGIVYLRMNEKQKAEDYFNRVLEIGDEQDKKYVRYYMEQL